MSTDSNTKKRTFKEINDCNNELDNMLNYIFDDDVVEDLESPLKKQKLSNKTKLTIESQKRKQEWNTTNTWLKEECFNTSSSCLYHQKCTELMKKFVAILNINDAMFEPNGNRCFCTICHDKRGDEDTYSRGKPLKTYVIPIDYVRFGIKLSSEQTEKNILDEWHVVYHGTKWEHLKEIIESGLILLKPNDLKLNQNVPIYETNKIRSGHIQEEFMRINKYTGKNEKFDPQQIFTSPSCIYSSYYSDTIEIDGNVISFMFQCRQKPGTYSIGQETMGFYQKKIDKYINNNCIEFYTKHNLNIAITGILMKIHNFMDDEDKETEKECLDCNGTGLYERKCVDCNGRGYCFECNGSGLFKKALMCYKCDGSGEYRNMQCCFKCHGSGIYKPAVQCRYCVGTGACNKCNDTGIFKVKCRKCDGTGIVQC